MRINSAARIALACGSPFNWSGALSRVLIVDDESGIRFALKRWFERQQWTVVEARDGHEAIEALDGSVALSAPFDLVVCDLHLPGVSGEDIVLRLRTDHPALVAKVILTTGDAIDDAMPGSVLATHPHVLQKPFDLVTLRAFVERLQTN
ncbi:response regulator [Gemmatimonas sp.]